MQQSWVNETTSASRPVLSGPRIAPGSQQAATTLELVSQLPGVTPEHMRKFIEMRFPEFVYLCGNEPRARVLPNDLYMKINDVCNTIVKALAVIPGLSDTRVRTVVTPFNVTEVLDVNGYSAAQCTKEEREALIGKLSGPKTTFTEEKALLAPRVLRYTNGNEVFYVPGVYSLPDTSYINTSKFEVIPFSRTIALSVRVIGTFYSLQNGVFRQLANSDAGKKLLGWEHLLSPAYTSAYGINAFNLQKWFEDNGQPLVGVSRHGHAFCHELYLVVMRGLRTYQQGMMDALAGLVNSITRVPFLIRGDDGQWNVTPSQLEFPTSLGMEQLSVTKADKCKATPAQAFQALQLARTVRGENAGERGVSTRSAYVGLAVHSAMAETMYMDANLSRFMNGVEDVCIFADSGKTSASQVQVLQALSMYGFTGRVFVQSSPALRGVLTPRITDQGVFTYGRADFLVHMVPTMLYYCHKLRPKYLLESAPFPGAQTLVIDLRAVLPIGNVNNFGNYSREVVDTFRTRIGEWESWGRAVLTRVPLVDQLIDLRSVTKIPLNFYTGIEIHNMNVWATFALGPIGDGDWWYHVIDKLVVSQVSAASIISNIVRCNHALCFLPPQMVLKQCGYKGVAMSWKSLSKMPVLTTMYTRVDVEEMLKLPPEELKEAIAAMGAADQATLIADSRVVAQMQIPTQRREEVPQVKPMSTVGEDLSSFYSED